MITYSGFIGEIRRLVEVAESLRNAKLIHEDPDFRKWRNELESTLTQIVQVDYLLPCPVIAHLRSFGYTQRSLNTDNELRESYQRDIDDTINELKVIVDSFEKHGEPPKDSRSKKRSEDSAKWPGKITLSWLYHNAPLSLWLCLLATLLAVFIFGTQIGQSDWYQEFQETVSAKNVNNE